MTNDTIYQELTGETPLNKIEQFFYVNASWSHDPATETEEQGHRRRARLLAKAEQHARENNWRYDWDFDHEADKCEGEVHEHYWCQMWAVDGDMLGSLCEICSPDANYRRVVEAELALEAMTESAAGNATVDARTALSNLLDALQAIHEPHAGDTDAFWVAGNIRREVIDAARQCVVEVAQ